MKSFITFLAVVLVTTSSNSQTPQVIDLNPTPQSLITSPNDVITITFDQILDPATVNADSFMVFGRWSGPMQGTYGFTSSNAQVTFIPDRGFFYGEWVSVRLTSAITSETGVPFTNGYGYNFWIKTLPAVLNQTLINQFSVEMSGETFVQCYGAYAGDVNDDEFTDLVVVTETAEDIRVFLNDGMGNYDNFTLFDMPNSGRPSTNEGSDFNHDGKIDIAIGSTENDNVSVFMGDNTNIFEPEIGFSADTGVRGITVIDIDGDGWDDIITANRNADNFSILINDGTGSFNSATNYEAGVTSETSIVAIDLNNDGAIDIAIGGYDSNNIRTLLNDGQGNFIQEDLVEISGSPWMLTAGDIDGDGNADVVSVNSSSGEVSILVGDGTGNLSLSGEYPVGIFSLAIDLGDIDGDGDLDFIASNFNSSDFTLYENIGFGIFSNPINYNSVQAGSCAILHDRNNDGALDITLIDELEDVVILYENSLLLDLEDESLSEEFQLFPNPFVDKIHIYGDIDFNATIRILDIEGRLLLTEKIQSNKAINLSWLNLSDGIYIIVLHEGNKTSRKRVAKTSY